MKKLFNKLFILITVILSVCFIVLWLYRNIFFPRRYKNIVEQASSIYNVDPNLIYSIIKQESNFNKDSISRSGAKGLMQLMDNTAKDMVRNVDSINSNNYDIFEPYTNILLGTKYISYLINHFDGNYYLAIIAYNAGMGNISNWITDDYSNYVTFLEVYNCIKYKETKDYLQNVITYYDYYTKLYNCDIKK